jgi:hypothetical protein
MILPLELLLEKVLLKCSNNHIYSIGAFGNVRVCWINGKVH